jgi:AmpD protein
VSGDDSGEDWRDGWLGRARRCPSPNFGPRPPGSIVDLVVVHSISLPPGEFGGHSDRAALRELPRLRRAPGLRRHPRPQVSSHFLLRRSGELVQFVSCDERAWHAGQSSWRGRAGCNDYSVGIELEGLAGSAFEAAQYEALATLIRDLLARYPVRDVAGHEHVARVARTTRNGFDWPRLRRARAAPTSFPP